MALRKNKIELLDKSISIEVEMDLDYYNNYWNYYYEDYYYPDYDDGDGCWDYIPIESSDDSILIHSYGIGRRTINKSPNIGRMIDMNTIYPKHIMREKKINQILGLEYHYMYKPTLAEIFPKNISINED